jgi:hypothetical protein
MILFSIIMTPQKAKTPYAVYIGNALELTVKRDHPSFLALEAVNTESRKDYLAESVFKDLQNKQGAKILKSEPLKIEIISNENKSEEDYANYEVSASRYNPSYKSSNGDETDEPVITDEVSREIARENLFRKYESQELSKNKLNSQNEMPPPVKVSRTSTGKMLLNGSLKLEGVGYVPGDTIEIRKIENGIAREIGKVNMIESSYTIELEQPVGSIIAQVVNKEGKVKGEGVVRIASLLKNKNPLKNQDSGLKKNKKSETNDLDSEISIKPLNDKIQPVFYSADSYDESKKKSISSLNVNIDNLDDYFKTDKKGSILISDISKGSSVLARAENSKYSKLNVILSAGKDHFIPVFPVKMVEALKSILRDQKLFSSASENGSLIWGKVTKDGKPVQGVKVVIEGQEDIIPVYLNALMIPDPSMETTGDNGMYVFMDVSEGYQSLLALKDQMYVAHANVVVESETLSIGDMETTQRKEPVDIRVFDAFTGQLRSAEVAFQNEMEPVQISGYLQINFSSVNKTSISYVKPEDGYMDMLVTYSDQADHIHIPLITTEWFRDLRTQIRLNDGPQNGNVFGFVPEEDFEVYLSGTGADNNERARLVYFDSAGKRLEGNKGQAGGGFIIYNITPGAHSLVIIGSKTQKIFTQVIPIDPAKTTMIGGALN